MKRIFDRNTHFPRKITKHRNVSEYHMIKRMIITSRVNRKVNFRAQRKHNMNEDSSRRLSRRRWKTSRLGHAKLFEEVLRRSPKSRRTASWSWVPCRVMVDGLLREKCDKRRQINLWSRNELGGSMTWIWVRPLVSSNLQWKRDKYVLWSQPTHVIVASDQGWAKI